MPNSTRRNVAILPGTEEHSRLISPSKIPSILGISRFQSQYALWHTMRGTLQRSDSGPRDIFEVGLAFELAMAELYRVRHPEWKLSPGEVQFTDDGGEHGFPFVCTIDRRVSKGRTRRVLELKTARDLSTWGDEGTSDAPQDYTAQVLAQMLFSGYTKEPAHLMVMGPFFKEYLYEIPYDKKVAEWIIRECKWFWESLQSGQEPELDDSVSTYECVRAMHPDITPEMRVDIPEALWTELKAASIEMKSNEKLLRGIKTRVLDTVGDAQFVTVNNEVVAVRQPHARGSVALVLKA